MLPDESLCIWHDPAQLRNHTTKFRNFVNETRWLCEFFRPTCLQPLFSKSNPPIPRENLRGAPLSSPKPHSATTLTLEMIEKLCQSGKLLSTSSSKATVEFLLVDGRTEVLVQPTQSREVTMAQIALVGVAVPTRCGGGIVGIRSSVPRQELVGDDS